MTREMADDDRGRHGRVAGGPRFPPHTRTRLVNEEIERADHLSGSPPWNFSRYRGYRALALAVMMPLLCLYADLLGMLGGRPPSSSGLLQQTSLPG